MDAYKPQEDFFDSTLMERVKDARPKPAKELEKTSKLWPFYH